MGQEEDSETRRGKPAYKIKRLDKLASSVVCDMGYFMPIFGFSVLENMTEGQDHEKVFPMLTYRL